MGKRLTTIEYWDAGYRNRSSKEVCGTAESLPIWKNLPNYIIKKKIESAFLGSNSILEVGAGGSELLLELADIHPELSFYGLDYSITGCELLQQRAKERRLGNLEAIHADLFDYEKDDTVGFDFVYSIGVVEHFESLPQVLSGVAALLNSSGVIFTLIPNMAGILGMLTKRWNRAIYDIHVPHTLPSLVAGHTAAGLTVIDSGYLCSTNFGVLSSCFSEKESRLSFKIYLLLTRLSKILWWFETKGIPIPKTPWLSPYQFVLAKKCSSKISAR